MAASSINLHRARPADIDFIMATERAPGFERLVGRSSKDEHFMALAAPGIAYLLGRSEGGEPMAFAIFRDIDDAHGNVCLKRIAVVRPGARFGSRFLHMVVDWAFREIPLHRLWLSVLADNLRALHVYRTQGFVEEGVMREAFRFPDETRADLIIMSLTRPEWITRPRAAG